MKIFLISDTHGKTNEAIEALSKLNDIDLIIHLGDYIEDAKRISKVSGTPLEYVGGNMDGVYDSSGMKVIESEFGKLLLLHGHMQNVKRNPQTLLYLADELGCKAVFFGHTHSPIFEEINGKYLINPGSISKPRNTLYGSYAVVNLTEDELTGDIFFTSNEKKESTFKGKLKDVLNNSDRF